MQERNLKKRKQRGHTLVEVLTAASMSVVVLFAVVLSLLTGMQSWARGQGKINAEVSSQATIRMISQELRQAMSVTVESSGNALEYRLPQKDGSGDYVVPATWDGIIRKIRYVSDGETGHIELGPVSNLRTICEDVSLVDPLTSTSYKLFTAGDGSITRQLTVQIVAKTLGSGNKKVTSRTRETIYLRNIPSLTQ